MTRTLSVGVALVGVWLISAPEVAQARQRASAQPLAPLGTLIKQLNRGIRAVVRGKPASRAFGAIQTTAKPRLAAALKQAGARSAQLIGMELELIFNQGAVVTYYLRTFVVNTPRGPAFLQFRGRAPADGKSYVTGEPLGAYRGAATPFRKAATSLLRALQGTRCRHLPLAVVSDFDGINLPPRMRKKLQRGVLKSRRRLSQACAALRTVRSHQVKLRIDDLAFAVLGAGNTYLGSIKADFRLIRGTLNLRLKRIRRDR